MRTFIVFSNNRPLRKEKTELGNTKLLTYISETIAKGRQYKVDIYNEEGNYETTLS